MHNVPKKGINSNFKNFIDYAALKDRGGRFDCFPGLYSGCLNNILLAFMLGKFAHLTVIIISSLHFALGILLGASDIFRHILFKIYLMEGRIIMQNHGELVSLVKIYRSILY